MPDKAEEQKIYITEVGGMPNATFGSGYNTPYSYRPATYEELGKHALSMLDYYKNQAELYRNRGQNENSPFIQNAIKAYNDLGGDAAYKKLSNGEYDASIIAKIFPTLDKTQLTTFSKGEPVKSAYVTDPKTGNLTTQAALDQQAKQAEGIANGTLKNIGTAEAPLTVPVGSAADKVATAIKEGTVSPTNPTQQYNEALKGNNVNSPGVVPNAPNAPAPAAPAAAASPGGVTGILPNGEKATFIDEATAKQYGATNIQGGTPAPDGSAKSGQVTGMYNGVRTVFTDEASAKQNGATDIQAAGGGIGSTGSGSSGGTTANDPTKAPTGTPFVNSDAYKRLSPEQQAMANSVYNIFSVGTEAQAKLLVDSIQKSQANADPYFKSLLDLTLGQVTSQVAKINGDYELSAKIVQKTQQDLLSNVSAQKDFLSLDEQAQLVTLARGYDQDVLNLRDEAASKGLVFATGFKSSAQMEAERTSQYNDVVQSTQRTLNYNVDTLTRKAQQGDSDALLKLETLNKTKADQIKALGFQTESSVGSANTNISGYTPVGGVMGSIEEQHKKDVLAGITNYFNLNNTAINAGSN